MLTISLIISVLIMLIPLIIAIKAKRRGRKP